ncbi:MAG: molybdate ABC transporter substrate-binding protein, partial [Planctomycetes bacterium]|nr:molybdate ABC transporter substrate-binding protein [Planctomycetota bacterium]
EAIAKEYEKDYGQRVEVRFGPSQTILSSFELTQKGDLFLPADDSYIQIAKDKGLVRGGDIFNLARMVAVVIVRPDFPRKMETWDDFIAKDNKIGLANLEAAAISKVLKRQLQVAKLWKTMEDHQPSYLGNVNEVFNSVHNVKSVDVGIIWDVIAKPHASAKVVKLKELENVQARVQIAIAKNTTQRDNAIHFIRYLRAEDKGYPHLAKQGFSDIEKRGPMDERTELVIHAGAMLSPALGPILKEFEKRENVRIITVYNGCGILVSQMQTGETPDVYFACDASFMDQVNDRFENRTTISSNQLMIVVKKGNPHQVKELVDLAKPGLRVGVGHEQNCALGALTKETFVIKGVYAKVAANIKVTLPTGDGLVNNLRAGGLDVVIAYRSNVAPFDDIEGTPIEGVKCATASQPIAISKTSANAKVSQRLMEFLRTPESRERFEKLGFGWEVKEKVEEPRSK